jgi:hypothetical protein
VLLAIASTAFALVLVEGGVRVWIWATTPTLWSLDDERGWAHRPGVARIEETEGVRARVSINALGLRGPVHVGPTTRHRVLILGDSFTEGITVEDDELFSVLLERQNPDLEVVNAGVIGYGTVQEAITLKRVEPLVHPVVTVLLVVRNDLRDNVTPMAPWIGPRPFADLDGSYQPITWQPFRPYLPPLPNAAWWYRNSIAVQLWQRRRIDRLVHMQLYDFYIEHWWRTPRSIEWQVLETWIAAIGQERTLVVVAVPHRGDLVTGQRWFTDGVGDIAHRHRFAFVNLQDTLTAEDYLFIHWNAQGHSRVARSIAPAIEKAVASVTSPR